MRAFRAIVTACALACGCQPGMSTTPAVTPVPSRALALKLYLAPEPTVTSVDDADGRPIALTLQHAVRDVLEEAGFHLVATPEDASGVSARVFIRRVGVIHADLFIHGAEACGVRLDITRGDALLASAHPEVDCLSTSTYYGMLPRDAAVALVNQASQSPTLLAVAEALRSPAPPR